MVFKNLCVVVLWTKVALALEGFKILNGRNVHQNLEISQSQNCMFKKIRVTLGILTKYKQESG